MKTSIRKILGGMLAVLLAGSLGVGCATTEMTSEWVDPTARNAPPLRKVAIVCLTADPGLRRMAEDTAAAQLQGARAVPSYQVLGDAVLRDRTLVKNMLMTAGFDGVLVMRLTNVSERVTAAPGPYYNSFDGYWDYAGAAVYSPGYLETETVVHVVSNLYSLNQNKLIWSGTSQTFDPSSAKSFMDDVAKTVAKSLQQDRIIL
jgi:hypothetical protein